MKATGGKLSLSRLDACFWDTLLSLCAVEAAIVVENGFYCMLPGDSRLYMY